MPARGSIRARGHGKVHRRPSNKLPYEVFAPGSKRKAGELIGAFETMHAATRALNAWWTVQALLALLATQEPAEQREAS